MALPPGPRIPPALQTLAWVTRPGPFMERARERHGDVFTVRLAQVGTFVFLSDPETVRRVFTGDPDLLRAGEANRPLEPVVGPRSILLLDGAAHLRERRLLLPPFHGERLTRYREAIAEIAAAEVDRWPRGAPFALQPRMQAITLEVILRVVFGVRETARLEPLRRALLALLAAGTRPAVMLPWLRRDLGPGSPFRRFLAARSAVDAQLYDLIASRRADPDLETCDDILALLLRARDEDGQPMSDGELRDELVTLLVAGHETTATGLAWAFERLFNHRDALERLTQEARAGDEDRYAEAVVTETLRLRPPIPVVARKLAAPLELGGHEIPAGVRLTPCIWLVHRRPDVYPDPLAFRPERFLERPPEPGSADTGLRLGGGRQARRCWAEHPQGDPFGARPNPHGDGEPAPRRPRDRWIQAETYTWLPFGGGIRRCVGASFATFEMKVVLHAVLARARLRAAAPQGERVRRRAIVLAPARGARAVLDPGSTRATSRGGARLPSHRYRGGLTG